MKKSRGREELVEELILAASGQIKADLVIKGARLINVYSGEITPDTDVAVKAERIAYLGQNASHTLGPKTKVIEAKGRFLAPGFIDTHTHLDLYLSPTEYVRHFIIHGTTCLFAEPAEFVAVMGYQGLKLYLREASRWPIRHYTMLPMCSLQDPLLGSAHRLTVEEVEEALDWPEVKGLGETVAWRRILNLDDEYMKKMRATLAAGKRIEGHTSGAHDWRMAAQVAAGISSCHESIQAEDVLERLRLGLWTMIRHGGVRNDLTRALPALLKAEVDTRRAVLVSDGIDPVTLVEHGHMDFLVREAIAQGMKPVKAIQMATLNPAEYFGMEQDLGGIAPGRWADMVLLEDLEKVQVWATLTGGQLLSKEGELVVPMPSFSYPGYSLKTIKVPKPLMAESFQIKGTGLSARVRIIKFVAESISQESVEELPLIASQVVALPERDLLKAAVIDRHWNTGRLCLGLVKGFGCRLGGVASSVNFDENNIVAVGCHDADMALAVNRIIKNQGGIVLADKGKILEQLPLPLAGTCSLKRAEYVAEKLLAINSRLKQAGAAFDRPLNALIFLTFVTLPAIKMTDRGIVDVKNRRFVSLFVE